MPSTVNTPTLPALRWKYQGARHDYSLTARDRDDFYRAVWREGKPQLAVAHTLLQRFAYLYSTTRPYSTLSSFLRAYVQPINPRWFSSGDLHKAQVARLEKAGKGAEALAEKARAKKREAYAVTPITSIPREYNELSALVLSGATTSPVPTALHFIMSSAGAGDDELTARDKALAEATRKGLVLVPIAEGYRRGLNWFFSTGMTPPVIRYSELPATKPIATMIAVVLVGGLMWAALSGYLSASKIEDENEW
jgi:hypothetical protein